MEDIKMVDTPLADKELKRYFEDIFFFNHRAHS